jgi:hypothetical protein
VSTGLCIRLSLGFALATAACSLGCSTKEDFVARSTSDGGGALILPPVHKMCEPGKYSGQMFTKAGDGGLPIQYTANISFELTEERNGEIQVLQNTTMLEGSSSDKSTFAADIVGSSCSEGMFESTLTNGTYTFFSSADQATPASVGFEGTILGFYEASNHDFSGQWSTTLHFVGMDVHVGGLWIAIRQ